MKLFLRLLALSAISFAPISYAASITSFNDGFEGETATTSVLNFDNFQKWTVSAGTVDLINNVNRWGISCNSGSWCVDLDGSTRDAGTMTTTDTFSAGTYKVNFAISGSQRGTASDTLEFGFGTNSNIFETITLNANAEWQTLSYLLTIGDGEKFVFKHLGGDNIGMILDDVSISAVPLPAAVWLFGSGLMGFMALRRRSKAQIA